MTTIETLKAELAIANDRAAKAEASAQSFFKNADFFMRACDEQKKRAEAAEQQFSEYVKRVEADLQFWRARAEAAAALLSKAREGLRIARESITTGFSTVRAITVIDALLAEIGGSDE